jgi:predicted nucleotidyltransferase
MIPSMHKQLSSPIDLATIRDVAQLIVERFAPERVILFGSYARDQAGDHSDVDLLVEMRLSDRSTRGNPVRRAIAERFVLPMDIVIRTPEAVAKHRDNPYSLVHQALKEGIILYDRHAA